MIEVVLEHVDEVDPHQRVARDLDRVVHVGERDRVGRVHLVRAVEVGVEPVHHHHHLLGVLAAVGGVDDEGAVEALGDVLGQRPHVAVVEVQAGGQGVELVDRLAAGLDLAGADPGHAVHLGRVDAVEVDRVRVGGAVGEGDPQALALAAAQRRPGDALVVGPGRELHARGDLDLLVDRVELPLAQHAAVGHPRRLAPVEVAQDLVRVEAVGRVVDRAVVAEVGVPVVDRVVGAVLLGRLRPRMAVGDGAVQERGRRRWRRCLRPAAFVRVSSATRSIMARLNLFVEQPRRAASARGRASARRGSARGRRAAAAPPRRPGPTGRGR